MVAIYTAVAGEYDPLPPHPDIPGVEFVAFVDSRQVEPNGWEIRLNPQLNDRHPRMVAKAPKVFPELYLPDHKYTVWIDASHEILTPHFADHAIAALHDVDIAVYEHPWRDCIYDEAVASLDLRKYQGLPIAEQVASYRAEGYPEHGGLFACGTIARRNTPTVSRLMAEWWDEIETWTYQDQLSFPVVCRRLGVTPARFPLHQVFNNQWTAIRAHHSDD